MTIHLSAAAMVAGEKNCRSLDCAPNDKRLGAGVVAHSSQRGLEWATQSIGGWCRELCHFSLHSPWQAGAGGMTKGRVGFPFGIGCTDPRSQTRDLGHPSLVSDAASWVVLIRH